MSLIISFMLGSLLGVWIMCAMITAGDADDMEESWFDRKEDK